MFTNWKIHWAVAIACVAIGFGSVNAYQTPDPPSSEPWKQVEDAVVQGLPRTAIEKLGSIIKAALANKKYPEAIKGIARRIQLETEGAYKHDLEKAIRKFGEEIDKAPVEMRPILHLLQARSYLNYFEENRWFFAERTATATPPGEAIATWDLQRLFDQIDFHLFTALQAEEELKAIPIADYDDLLIQGTLPDSYRPTLYDFVAFEALSFYSVAEQGGARPQDHFEFEANSPAFGTTEEFLAWEPTTTDENSIGIKGIRLFQKVLKYHQSDEDKSAYLDADLGRLQFAYANSVGEERKARYISALKRFINANNLHELSATARFRWAKLVAEDNERVEAKRISTEGKNASPESIGGKSCASLILEIESPSLTLTTERVWSIPASRIEASYKNLDKVYLRLHPADWIEQLRTTGYPPRTPSPEELDLLSTKAPVRQWAVDLPPAPDYNFKLFSFEAPTDLPPGFYCLQASADPSFSESNNVVSAVGVWVSNLEIIENQSRSYYRGEELTKIVEGFVVNNVTGTPIADAKVTAFTLANGNPYSVGEETTLTDEGGKFKFTFDFQEKQVYLHVQHGEQALTARDGIYIGLRYGESPHPTEKQTRAVLFTDRSLLRPGQQVHFKGICYRANTKENNYQVVPNYEVEARFHDTNGSVIETRSLRTNDFGSFSGTFDIPHNRGTGEMSIIVDDLASATIQVEEYKRPKFTVELNSPTESPKLNEVVAVRGNAKSYTGAPIQNGKVIYRVQRSVRWPDWFTSIFPWRFSSYRSSDQEIAHGTTTTDEDGNFEVKFTAKPDLSVDEDTNPIFRYQITVNITDSNGETRSNNYSVSVGYTAMDAKISAGDWLTTEAPVVFNVSTNSLDGKPLPSKGVVKVYRLVEPAQVPRRDFLTRAYPMTDWLAPNSNRLLPGTVPRKDIRNLANWEQGELIHETSFEWKEDSKRQVSLELPKGAFRAVVQSKDRFGKPVQGMTNVLVIDPEANSLGIKVPHYFQAEKWTLEPGETFRAVWGTGHARGGAYIEIASDEKVFQKFWANPQSTQIKIEQKITEEMRGGLAIRVIYVQENRSHLENRTIEVPWTNKDLTLKWERLVSKLEPGAKEKYKLTVRGPKAENAVAELVSAMYDASLDAFYPHHWMEKFSVFRRNNGWPYWRSQNGAKTLSHMRGSFGELSEMVNETYRRFPPELGYGLESEWFGIPWGMGFGGGMMGGMGGMGSVGGMAMGDDMVMLSSMYDPALEESHPSAQGAVPSIDLGNVPPRKNLQETAFFLPHVTAGKDGSFELEFTVPEALTSWKIMAFAHDRELRSGYLEAEVVTKKDLMVEPNPPRFLREGDILEFSVKVSNTSEETQRGKVALKLSSALTDQPVDTEFGNTNIEQLLELKGGESKSFTWKLQVPDATYPIIYRAIGGTEKVSDGEEGMLPILSNRILVTESLPLPIRGKSTKEFDFKKLLESGSSDTLKNQSFTVQMVSQPSWYAVLALPYLMEYPHECSEQTFNRLYANSLAQHIAKSDPKIRRVLDVWKNLQPDALVSPLEKNQDLKMVMIEETPWLRDAQKETEARRNVGLLFDEARLLSETARALQRLSEMQNANGMWPWFAGGPDNEYLSLYIVTGFGRLKHLGVEIDTSPALRGLQRLDSWIREKHERILEKSDDPSKNHLSSTICLYLYGRSFFMNELPIDESNQTAFNYWKGQAAKYWLSQPRQSQAQLALALKRLDDKETPTAILKSIVEFSSTNEEMGMFWNDQQRSWWWYEAPIETQAILIEALDEVAKDAKSVEECKVWLLKQKQTQNWKTTKSTADAVYALLLRGTNLLASDELVAVEIGGETIQPTNVEAGTGFYEEKFLRGEIKPEFGKIKVTKKDEGVSWGSVHWEYLEDISKITPHDGTPLKLEKKLFRKENTKSGPKLVELEGAVSVGDELVSRIILRTDRDMEYVHLKDHRGSGTEPVNVLSRYRHQDGLWYYESTRDTASHFFIDYLPKGTYVFEYSVRVQHAGTYPSGLASIECMYAPEFNSHSGSVLIEAK